ncbi:MAG: type II toxin-antitoxin system death-on-curing family toxin [Candidatus Nitrosocaldaceae archaeon]
MINYIDEEVINEIRKKLNLPTTIINKSALSYILSSVKDLYNDDENDLKDILSKKAAYILFNMVTLHPFLDGNKRTAFAAANIFLRLNGYHINIQHEEGVRFIISIAKGEYNEIDVRKWIKKYIKRFESN